MQKISCLSLFIIFNIMIVSAQSDSLQCSGALILLTVDSLFELIPNPGSSTFDRPPLVPVSALEKGPHSAIGYRKTDHSIYGIDYLRFPYTRLFRINPDGTKDILDSLFNNGFDSWGIASGDLTKDQRNFVLIRPVGDFSTFPESDPNRLNNIFIIDLEDPSYSIDTLVITTTGENAGVSISDIAIDPISGIGYGFDYYTNRLITLDPTTGVVDNSSFPVIDLSFIGDQLPAVWFSPFGKLIGAFNNDDSDVMIYFNKETGLIENVLTRPRQTLTDGFDGCSCPFTVAISKQVKPDTVFNCLSFDVVNTIAYWMESEQGELTFRDSFPTGFLIEEVLYNPYGGQVEGLGTNQLLIKNIAPVIGVDSIILRVKVPEGTAPGAYECQANLSGLNMEELNNMETTIYSDNPNTELKADPSPIWVLDFEHYINQQAYALCPDSSVQLYLLPTSSAGFLQYQWSTGQTTPSIEVQKAGSYAVTVSGGCQTYSFDIPVIDGAINVNLGGDRSVPIGDMVVLDPTIDSEGIITVYEWTVADTVVQKCPGCNSFSLSPLSNSTNVALSVENQYGCEAEAEVQLTLSYPVYAPNAFSPNGDGYNDVFYLQTPEPVTLESFTVFDRWGSLAFSREHTITNAPDAGWNGRVQNEAAALGIYAWQATLEYENGHRHQIKGEVMLVR